MRTSKISALLCLVICTLSSFAVRAGDPAVFWLIAKPNVNEPIGVLGIITAPVNRSISSTQAISIAYFAQRQYNNVKTWHVVQVYLFTDEAAAQQFAAYQNQRQNRALTFADFRNLQSLWPRTRIFYEYNRDKKGRERVGYPSRSVSDWWLKLSTPSKPRK